MGRVSSKWKWMLGIALISSVLSAVYLLSLKDEYCPVIDDLSEINAIKAVTAFNRSKIHYFVDLQHSYQILATKWQVEEAYTVLNKIGITARSKHQASCKVVH